MVGYHYTTLEAWEIIQVEGVRIAPLRKHEYDRFRSAIPKFPRDAIWVWKAPLTDEQAYIITLQLAETRRSFDFVLLKIHYETWASASLACKDVPSDKINLTCNFGAGRLKTPSLPIDLIICDVPSTNVEAIWQINLLDAFRDRHVMEL